MSATTFSARDVELFAKALRCLKDGEIQIDNDKFASEGGFKNSNSARVAWHALKKKLLATESVTFNTTAADSGENSSKTPASGRKRKAAAKGEGVGEDVESPTKKARLKKGRKPRSDSKAEGAMDGSTKSPEKLLMEQDDDTIVVAKPSKNDPRQATENPTTPPSGTAEEEQSKG